MSLDLIPETNQVMIGYGSGDQIPRVKIMPWQEVSALFPHMPHGSELVRMGCRGSDYAMNILALLPHMPHDSELVSMGAGVAIVL